MDKQQEKLSKEREAMLEDGTKVSSVKVRVVEPAPTTIDSTPSPATKTEEPAAELAVPKGIELVEEPYIASTAGQLVIEPRMVSTGGVVHPENAPASRTLGDRPAPNPEAKT